MERKLGRVFMAVPQHLPHPRLHRVVQDGCWSCTVHTRYVIWRKNADAGTGVLFNRALIGVVH